MSDASWVAGRAPVAPVAGRSGASSQNDDRMWPGQDRRLHIVHGSVRISFPLVELQKQVSCRAPVRTFVTHRKKREAEPTPALQRYCENGTPLNFVRAVRGTDGHTEGTTSAEHVQIFAMQCEGIVCLLDQGAGQRRQRHLRKMETHQGQTPSFFGSSRRKQLPPTPPEMMLRRTLGVILNGTGRSDQVVGPPIGTGPSALMKYMHFRRCQEHIGHKLLGASLDQPLDCQQTQRMN